jgi:hypothetical protein
MSREFGSYTSGYFHEQIDNCAVDCLKGRDPLTRLWGEFLQELYPVAYCIATSEAGDGGPHDSIITTIDKIETLKQKLQNIQGFIDPYKRVAEDAIRQMAEKNNKEKT